MIHNLYKRYLIIFSVLIVSVSCTKLDFTPTDTIDPGKAFRNIGDINMGLIGAYALLDNTMIINNSIVSDEVMLPTENTVSNTDAYRWLYTGSSGSVTALYGTYYQGIDRINRTIAGMDLLTFTGADIATSSRYRGELLALRAFLHFELLRAYAASYQNGALGVTYLTASTFDFLARDNFETTVAATKADLAAAKALIPTSFTDKSRITRIAVSAIQARLALYEKNWADAITYSTEVISALPLATKAQFPTIWTDATDTEVAWKAKRVATDTRTGDIYFRQSGGIVLYAPSFKLISTFDKVNDLRYAAYIKFDATRTGTKSQYLVNKYAGTTAVPGLADIKLFRTGEMYLIRAEAEAESAGDAAADLNALRAARITGYTNAVFADKAALITAIYNERFKELAFEGHRFFDLKRRNLPVERLPADAINASGAVTLLPSKAQYSFPLPAQELAINKNAVQNPNY
jgi:hypothetical protein